MPKSPHFLFLSKPQQKTTLKTRTHFFFISGGFRFISGRDCSAALVTPPFPIPSCRSPPRSARNRHSVLLGGMGLWTLLEGFLLLANALAILNEDRFLAPRGWSFSEVSGGKTKSLKGQIIGLIYATQYLRLPLILLNTLFIVVKMVSG